MPFLVLVNVVRIFGLILFLFISTTLYSIFVVIKRTELLMEHYKCHSVDRLMYIDATELIVDRRQPN